MSGINIRSDETRQDTINVPVICEKYVKTHDFVFRELCLLSFPLLLYLLTYLRFYLILSILIPRVRCVCGLIDRSNFSDLDSTLSTEPYGGIS